MYYQHREERFPALEVFNKLAEIPNHEYHPKDHKPRIGDRICCFHEHLHEDIEILLIMSDSVLHVVTDEESFDAHRGDIVVFEPFRMHSGYSDYYAPKLDFYVLSFSTDLLTQGTKGRFCAMLAGLYSGKVHLRTHMRAPDDIAIQMDRIYNFHQTTDSIVGEARVIAAIHELLGMMFESMLVDDDLKNDEIDPEFVLSVVNYVKDNYTHPLTTENICQIFNYSKSYFCHKFRQSFKCSFITYLNKYRIQMAITLCRQKQMTVSEISAAVGFHDISYFNRVFKQFTGITPSTVFESL